MISGDDVVVQFRAPGHRTPEEIAAQLEARMAEMEAEAARIKADPATHYPCSTCRHAKYEWGRTDRGMHCTNRLVIGLADISDSYQQIAVMDSAPANDWHQKHRPKAELCGPEKALWQPLPELEKAPILWQRIVAWFARAWGIEG